MKLRKPCEAHGKYDEHYVGPLIYGISDERCPGGVFLPDDTLVIEGGFNYTIRCAACELAGCHVGINGGHDDIDNPAVHTRDVWVLTELTEEQVENWDALSVREDV